MKNFVKALFILFLTFGHMSCSKNDDEPKKETLQPAKAIMMTFMSLMEVFLSLQK